MRLTLWILPIVIATPPFLQDSRTGITKGKKVHFYSFLESDSIPALQQSNKKARHSGPVAFKTGTSDATHFRSGKKGQVKKFQLGRARGSGITQDSDVLHAVSAGCGPPSTSMDSGKTSTPSDSSVTMQTNSHAPQYGYESDEHNELDLDEDQLAKDSAMNDEGNQAVESHGELSRDDLLKLPDDTSRNLRGSNKPTHILRRATMEALKSVEQELIMEFFGILEDRLDALAKTWASYNRIRDRIPFDGLLATHIFYSNGTQDGKLVSHIRLISQDGTFKRSNQLKIPCRRLVRYLLFQLVAFIQKLEIPGESIGQVRKGFFHWLVEQMFDVKDRSLPVMGRVNSEFQSHDPSAFGPSQFLLLTYLTTSRTEQVIHQTAGTLIKLWYAEYAHSLRCSPFRGNHDFWYFLNEALLVAEKSYRALSRLENKTHATEWVQDDSFQIIKIEKISHVRIPSRMHQCAARQALEEAKSRLITPEMSEELEEINARLVRRINECQKGFQTISGYKIEETPEVLVSLVPSFPRKLSKYAKREETYVVRLMSKSKALLSPSLLSRKLLVFLGQIQNYLVSLLDVLRERKSVELPFAFTHITNWLETKLFEDKEGIPVFGVTFRRNEPLDWTCFGTIQNYLIGYLTQAYMRPEFDQAFSFIIGYWLKSSFKGLWSTLFQNDEDYWVLIAEVVNKYLPTACNNLFGS